MVNAIQTRADELQTLRPAGRFVHKSAIEDEPAGASLVPAAVARAKEGDREAVRFLYLRYADNVYSYVRTIVQDDYEAEDVTQHVFAKLLTHIGRYEQRSVPFTAWIVRLAHNAAIDHLRTRRAVLAPEVFGADDRSSDGEDERSRGLREAIASLPEEQRDVVVLRHVVGLTPGEIADRLGRTESSIHGLHHRGRAALRTELQRRELAPSTLAEAA